MYDTLFQNGALFCESGLTPRGYLAVRAGRIAYMDTVPPKEQARRTVDLAGNYLSPGFIDMHVHGGGGSDFMDGTAQAFANAARMHLRHGTTTLCPTSMVSGDAALFAFLDGFAQAKALPGAMPRLPGVHLEGPYFSPGQAGAQPPQYMRQPYPDHCLRVLEHAGDSILRWSCAPEVPGVLELGDALRQRGILASIAHSDADLAQVERAMLHGFTHLTHFYSGMSSLRRADGRRVLGIVEAGYLHDGLTIEIIADGVHLPPELLRLIVKCKPLDKISLVTDAMRAAGMGAGPSILGGMRDGLPVYVEDGVAKMPDRQSFAGSVATADRLVRTMVRQAGLSPADAVRMLTLNPATLLGIEADTGSLAVGKAADVLVLDEDINILRVFVDGNEIDREELA